MATKNPQTLAKRAREQALREKRERKKEKKQAAALRRASGEPDFAATDDEIGEPALDDDAVPV